MKQPWYFPVLDFIAFTLRVALVTGAIICIVSLVVR